MTERVSGRSVIGAAAVGAALPSAATSVDALRAFPAAVIRPGAGRASLRDTAHLCERPA